MENNVDPSRLDMKALAQDYAKFTLKRDWPQIEATMRMYSEKPTEDPWYGLYQEALKIIKKQYRRPV